MKYGTRVRLDFSRMQCGVYDCGEDGIYKTGDTGRYVASNKYESLTVISDRTGKRITNLFPHEIIPIID